MNYNEFSIMRILKWFFFIIVVFSINYCKTTPKADLTLSNDDPRKVAITETDNNTDKLRAHMKNLFAIIEAMIANGDFEGWYNAISLKYKYYLNNIDNLKKIADESDFLYNRRVKLRNPKDFFIHVVIPSREGKTLQFVDYEYINNNHVKVICLFDKKEKLIYDFIFEEGIWKIDR